MVLADLRAMRWAAPGVATLIAIAVASAVAIGAQERGLRAASARAAADFDLVIGAPGSETQLVLTSVYLDLAALNLVEGTLMNELARDPRVAAAAPLAFGDVVSGFPVIGTTAAFASRWGRLAPSEGRLFEREGEAVVGSAVPFTTGQEITPSHGTAHRANDQAEEARHRHEEIVYSVLGRLPALGSPYDRAILVPIETVWGRTVSATGTRRRAASARHSTARRCRASRLSSSSRAGSRGPTPFAQLIEGTARLRCSRPRSSFRFTVGWATLATCSSWRPRSTRP